MGLALDQVEEVVVAAVEVVVAEEDLKASLPHPFLVRISQKRFWKRWGPVQ